MICFAITVQERVLCIYLSFSLDVLTLDGVIKGQWARDVVEVVVNSEEKQFPLFFLDKQCGAKEGKLKI